jgi:hypothetical protein
MKFIPSMISLSSIYGIIYRWLRLFEFKMSRPVSQIAWIEVSFVLIANRHAHQHSNNILDWDLGIALCNIFYLDHSIRRVFVLV